MNFSYILILLWLQFIYNLVLKLIKSSSELIFLPLYSIDQTIKQKGKPYITP